MITGLAAYGVATLSTEELEANLTKLKEEALTTLSSAKNADELEAARLHFAGQKGALTQLLRGLSQVNATDRPRIGQLANGIKVQIQQMLDERKESLFAKELEGKLQEERIDTTLPACGRSIGHIHPLTQVTEDLKQIFYGMGFTALDGPEVETEYYNFDALNTPFDHPARDSQDTFYTTINPKVILRSHMSPMQIRVMEETMQNKGEPPIRVVLAGRVYRNEEVNARKYPLFHQMEGLLIDRHVTFGQLKGTLNEFIRLLFGKPVKTRFRPDFFPFTEPSAELDAQCPFCAGKGCTTCGHRGWLELLGCGMVHPNVLKGAGIDPEAWSGFAFGMGIERLAMLKYGIDDIRHFYSNDMRFLEQF